MPCGPLLEISALTVEGILEVKMEAYICLKILAAHHRLPSVASTLQNSASAPGIRLPSQFKPTHPPKPSTPLRRPSQTAQTHKAPTVSPGKLHTLNLRTPPKAHAPTIQPGADGAATIFLAALISQEPSHD